MKALVPFACFAAAAMATPACAQSDADAGGAWIGASLAWSSRNADWLDLGVGPLGDHDARGVLASAQAGYDVDLGGLFVGIEGNLTPMGNSGRHIDKVFGTSTANTEREHSKEKWSAALGARVGTSLGGGFRLYGKGGLALSRKRYAITGYFAPDVVFAKTTATRSGWYLGAGVERSLGARTSTFLEFSHADFGRKLTRLGCVAAYPSCGSLDPTLVPVAIRETAERVAAGITYRF